MCVNVVLVIIHPLFKKRREKKNHSYKVSKSQGWNTKSTKVVWKTQSHITGEWWLGGGGDKKTLQAFFKVRVHAQITFTEYIYIYMYCIYMYIHTEKIFPKEMIKYSRSLLMQWCKEK